MYCIKKITDDLDWVGANDRRLAMFEGVYSVPEGVSYNSYLLHDEKTVLFDTVDRAVGKIFFENIAKSLDGKKLDYVVIHHMEPDHSATLAELLLRYPNVTIVCSQKIKVLINQFFGTDLTDKYLIVNEGSILKTGIHELTFVNAPMVHWPEVLMSYDSYSKILFSADAFGCFGALNGAIFADEVDFYGDYIDEARRYYTNIVGKYGQQVQAVLKKASTLDIRMICPLHGFVHRKNLNLFIDKYDKWSSYTPEVKGVMIAYASVYGDTENIAEILASKIVERGVTVKMFDVSVAHSSEIVSEAFKYSHLVFASTTYNMGVFITMDECLRDIAAHNLQNRTIAFIENGSWAPVSGKLMKEIIAPVPNNTIIENVITVKSAPKESQINDIELLADTISSTIITEFVPKNQLFNATYGLYVLTAKDGDKDNGCIINTLMQITDNPLRIMVSVNKNNYTHDIIMRTGEFNVSVLNKETPFSVFERFGFVSGKTVNKFEGCQCAEVRSTNSIRYLPDYTNGYISGKVVTTLDCGTHTIFLADVTEKVNLNGTESLTYSYYQDNIKPKTAKKNDGKKRWVCKVCGYVYDGEELPKDFECPLCHHGTDDFELI